MLTFPFFRSMDVETRLKASNEDILMQLLITKFCLDLFFVITAQQAIAFKCIFFVIFLTWVFCFFVVCTTRDMIKN